MNKQKVLLKTSAFPLAILFFLSGCVGNIVGTNVRQPKEGQAGTYSQIFDCPYPDCFEELQKIIMQDLRASINRKNPKKGIISALNFNSYYKNCNPTTEALISLQEIEPERTKIVVASGNYGLAEVISLKIFENLEKKFPQKR
jgi:hypothetical protein